MENEWKNKNFICALSNAFSGIKYVLKTQRNIKIQLFFAAIVILAGIILKINFIEFAIIVLTIFIVLFAECINTSLEVAINMYTQKYNENAKIAKDIAAGGVTLVSISSVIIGILIFLPKIIIVLSRI